MPEIRATDAPAIAPGQPAAPPAVVLQPLTLPERLYDSAFFRKALIVAALAAVWEVYGRMLDDENLFPTLGTTLAAWWSSTVSAERELPRAAAYTIGLLLQGYVLGLVFAAVLTAFASATRLGADLLETLTAMFNPLPSVALLPMALLWFGFGAGSLIFVLVHAVLWAVALNTHAGFRAVSPTLRMVGQNYGLSRLGFIWRILIPGAFPSILAGLKIGWAFAWRTLIAAELVFGANSAEGGLGWFIYLNKNVLNIPEVFAGLLTVILFGLFIENVIFTAIESRTVRRWGMQA
jgi:NitT/TauT family transport system permease protein